MIPLVGETTEFFECTPEAVLRVLKTRCILPVSPNSLLVTPGQAVLRPNITAEEDEDESAVSG
eukprot:CAMPEP_0173423136 /NCGR_PEP_ID=MMETSP1357-20121228/3564_1 /TAXON_ID=77926 /ORGANISM="Hemiselmis rufescens, Strain PCC563" /LENGTH=62 /DNA_ID=CAMNT_0014386221 /DNA_START=46 /DNA_END=231 /DNA_ORIENTATION=-